MAKVRRKLKRVIRKHHRLTTEEAERLVSWYKAVPELERVANSARERAHSHKGFHVGIGGIVRKPDGSTVVIDGSNRKGAPGPRGPLDHCAEDEMFKKLDKLGGELLGFVCVAPHQVDDFSGYDLGVTISCRSCRRQIEARLNENDRGVRPYTRAIFINAANRQKQVELRMDAMLQLCKSRDKSDPNGNSN